MMQGLVTYMAGLDKNLLDNLNKVGFKTDLGLDNMGLFASVSIPETEVPDLPQRI